MNTVTKGFTLIELLIVIGIIAVLGTVVVLTLNPAELLRQARDSNRISDLGTLKSAFALYLADVSSPNMGVAANCYAHIAGLGVNCGGRFSAGTTTADTTTEVDGNGWIPVNFALISSGAPISALPVDPTNTTTHFYAYRCGGSSCLEYELNAKMESVKFEGAASPSNVELNSKDGGSDDNLYEVGTDPALNL